MTFMMSEKTVEDNIYLKYGLEVQHLREAISRHDLLEDPEIKKMRKKNSTYLKPPSNKWHRKFPLCQKKESSWTT